MYCVCDRHRSHTHTHKNLRISQQLVCGLEQFDSHSYLLLHPPLPLHPLPRGEEQGKTVLLFKSNKKINLFGTRFQSGLTT